MYDVAGALRVSIGLFIRHLRQLPGDGPVDPDALTVAETGAMAWLYKEGASTPSALARAEQISPQSMGATLASLESRGFVERRADPGDGRRVVMSLTEAGLWALRHRRDAKSIAMATALEHFTPAELKQLLAAVPLIERLAQSI